MLHIKPFFHKDTSTFCYVVHDAITHDAIIIDPVLDFNETTHSLSQEFLTQILDYVRLNNLGVKLVIDTHCHADHFSAAFTLKNILKVKSAIGRGFITVQHHFAHVYKMAHDLPTYEPAYDILVDHGQILTAGTLSIRAIDVAGHTPSCMAYLIEDALFCGDALFRPELGCGRCDFPGGSAEKLYDSITKNVYTLPNNTRIFTGHDYPSKDAQPLGQTTVQDSKSNNIMLNATTSKEEFVDKRHKKDITLQPPKLLLAAMKINILGGQMPKSRNN